MNYNEAQEIIHRVRGVLDTEDNDEADNALLEVGTVLAEAVVDIAESLHDLADTQAGRNG